jgi:hypothetical protein
MSGNQSASANDDTHDRAAELRRGATETLPQIVEQSNEALREARIEFVYRVEKRRRDPHIRHLADPTDEVWQAASTIINLIVRALLMPVNCAATNWPVPGHPE